MAWQTPKVNWDLPDGVSEVDLNRIEGNIDYLNQTVTTGKTNLDTAIKTMGQTPASTAFADLVSAILNISKDANASVSEVIAGKTFYQGGSKKTGTMTNNSQTTFTPTTIDQAIEGYYPAGSKVLGDADLVTNNIRDGVNIFGVEGAFDPLINLTSQEFTVATGEVIDYYDLVDIVEGKAIKHVDGTFSKKSVPLYVGEGVNLSCIITMLTEDYGILANGYKLFGIKVSGDTVEVGTVLTVSYPTSKMYKLDDNRVLIIANDGYNFARIDIYTLNTSTLAVTCKTSSTTLVIYTNPTSTSLAVISSTQAVLTYVDRGSPYYTKVSLLSITNNTITQGDTQNLQASQGIFTSVCKISISKVVVCYTLLDYTYGLRAVIVDILGSNLSINTPKTIHSGTEYDRIGSINTLIEDSRVIVYCNYVTGSSYIDNKCIAFYIGTTTIGDVGDLVTVDTSNIQLNYPSIIKLKDNTYRLFYNNNPHSDWYTYQYSDITLNGLVISVGSSYIYDSHIHMDTAHTNIYPDKINERKFILPIFINPSYDNYLIHVIILYDIADGISLDAGEGGDTVTVKLFA